MGPTFLQMLQWSCVRCGEDVFGLIEVCDFIIGERIWLLVLPRDTLMGRFCDRVCVLYSFRGTKPQLQVLPEGLDSSSWV